jgi:hypothetical protein
VGEQQNQPFQLSLNPSLKVDLQGSRVTSDGGLLVVRELDERLRLSELISEHLTDSLAWISTVGNRSNRDMVDPRCARPGPRAHIIRCRLSRARPSTHFRGETRP